MRIAFVAWLALAAPSALLAQRAPAGRVVLPPDSAPPLAHRPAPLNYFFRSLVLPGWGQASLDRKLTAGLFIGFEGLALSMAMKANTELHFLERTDTASATVRRGERQDWYVLIGFNHLFSALEAYVSAHLVDFPRDLHIRAFPGQRPMFGVTIGLPH